MTSKAEKVWCYPLDFSWLVNDKELFFSWSNEVELFYPPPSRDIQMLEPFLKEIPINWIKSDRWWVDKRNSFLVGGSMVANYHFSGSADASLPRYTLCKMVSKWRWWCALFPSIIWLLQSRIVSGPFRVSLISQKEPIYLIFPLYFWQLWCRNLFPTIFRLKLLTGKSALWRAQSKTRKIMDIWKVALTLKST